MKPARSRRLRWSIASVMVMVAILAILCSALRPIEERTAVLHSAELLRKVQSGFDPSRYRVASAIRSGDGRFLRVTFEKTSGAGQAKTSAIVPIESGRVLGRRWW